MSKFLMKWHGLVACLSRLECRQDHLYLLYSVQFGSERHDSWLLAVLDPTVR